MFKCSDHGSRNAFFEWICAFDHVDLWCRGDIEELQNEMKRASLLVGDLLRMNEEDQSRIDALEREKLNSREREMLRAHTNRKQAQTIHQIRAENRNLQKRLAS